MISTNRAGHPWDKPGHDVVGGCQPTSRETRAHYSFPPAALMIVVQRATSLFTRLASAA